MFFSLLLLLFLLFQNGDPRSCGWTRGTEIGSLTDPIDEDSGLAISRRYRDRLYHVNDSGDIGRFFITNFAGNDLRTVKVRDFSPLDAEDLPTGAGGGSVACLLR